MRLFVLFSLLSISSLHAQIYADFTVSSGGNSLGTFTVTLEHEKAPRTTANFIGLASGRRPWVDLTTGAVRTDTPFYDGIIFHRLIHSFVIQAGSPNGTGGDGPGYSILDEYDSTLRHSTQYVLSMAKQGTSANGSGQLFGGPNTGGSQFFITLRATPELDDKHSVFGTVTAGTDIINGFKNPANFPTGASDKPVTPIVMDSVVIYGPDYAAFDIENPVLRLPHAVRTVFTPIRNAQTSQFSTQLDRTGKTNYFFATSTDLKSWAPLANVFSFDALDQEVLSFGVINSPKFFFNAASVSYSQIPNAPADLKSASHTVRIHYPDATRLDLFLDPDISAWEHSDQSGFPIKGGLLTSATWADQAPETGLSVDATRIAHRLAKGQLIVNFDEPAGPDSLSQLNVWLSFHTESTGWTEELGNFPNRHPFEILSN